MLRLRCGALFNTSHHLHGNRYLQKAKSKKCTQFTTNASLAIRKMATKNWKMATNHSSLNLGHVAETVALGAVEVGDRVVCIQPQLLPLSFDVVLPMRLESLHAIELVLQCFSSASVPRARATQCG